MSTLPPRPWRNDGIDCFENDGEWQWVIEDANGDLVALIPTDKMGCAWSDVGDSNKHIADAIVAIVNAAE